MKTLRWIGQIVHRKNKWLYLISGFATVVTVFLTLTIPLYIQFFMDAIMDDQPSKLSFGLGYVVELFGGIQQLKNKIWLSGAIVIVITLFNGVFSFLRERCASIASETSIKELKDWLYGHIQNLPFEYFNQMQTGDLIQRCTSDVDTVRKFLSSQVLEIFRILCLVVISLWIMFSVNVRLALSSVVVIPFIYVFSYVFFVKVKAAFLNSDVKEGELTTVLQENLSGIRVVKAFGRGKYEMDKFQEKNVELNRLNFKLIRILGVFWSVSDLFCLTQIGIVLVTGTLMAYRDEITVGVLILFVTYVSMLIWPVRQLGRILSDYGKMEVSLNRIFEILNAEEEKDTEGALEPDLRGPIVFENVSFAYEKDAPALKNISFQVSPGQTVAILGSTGSGKSTLMYLLLRLYDYQEGTVTINGVELKKIRKQWLRKQIGIVLQEPFLFSKTVRDNIKMSKDEATDYEVVDATSIASVHHVIEKFEKGYETLVGEKGVTLSGGQKQRLAIARNVIRESQMFIFDDSLSAVDTETDAQIRNELKQLQKNTVTFIISQRITTLMAADKILVMEDGRITEMGTHDQLVLGNGLYARIWKIQSMLEEDFLAEKED